MPIYQYRSLPDSDAARELALYDRYLQQLLFARGITTRAEAENFLSPQYDEHLHDPLLLNDIVAACDRIHAAVAAKETIAIFSDYDCDGIPGAVVLHDFFKAIGHEQFFNYIPHRHYEGFGLSVAAVDACLQKGATLIITIDCGTSDREAITYAHEKQLTVIVTDHHEPGEVLPPALAIVNPKLGDYPFTELCGAGVVYKLVQALIKTGDYALPPGREKWWLDMVGIATIADMVPLVGENRVLAHYGLQVLRKSRRPGVQSLLRKARVDQRTLSEEDIGFTIGPRINASSRMDMPEYAFALLSATDDAEAKAHLDHLERLNTERRTAVALMTKEAHQRLKQQLEVPPVLVLGNPEWRPSLAGLVANKLAEEYSRPVFVWGRDGNEKYKGSCRAGGGVSVVRLMEEAATLFLEFGGHHASGGFTVRDEHIYTFGETINDIYRARGDVLKVAEPVYVDSTLSLDEVFGPLRQTLAVLAPYGAGNPKPLFAFPQVVPERVEQFGKVKEHMKMVFKTKEGTLEAIAFFTSPESFSVPLHAGSPLTLYAHIEESFFMNRRQTRLRIVDVSI